MRYSRPLLVLAVGLAALLVVAWLWFPSIAAPEQRGTLLAASVAATAIVGVAAIAAGLLQRRSRLRSARLLDAKLAAKNRIETATTFRNDEGLLLRAQREETSDFLSTAPVPSRNRFLVLLTGTVFILFIAHLATVLFWTRPWELVSLPSPPQEPSADELPKASIRWESPEAETKAAPVEEISIKAIVESETGLDELILEISVNGGTPRTEPVPAAPLPGRHEIEVSIYLDELEVEPFDVVAYHLRARRVDPRPLPAVVSPVQFVQVKPFREDIREVESGDGNSAFPLILALKSAQLPLVKENFLLAHTEVSHESAGWTKENSRVASDQGVLVEKSQEVIQRFIADGMPAEIVNLLTQAHPLMGEARDKIMARENIAALAPQNRALAAITEIEKYFVKEKSSNPRSSNSQNVEDPFPDKKIFELQPRSKTPAGELETLAREQERLAADLCQTPKSPTADSAEQTGEGTIKGTPTERQEEALQRLGELVDRQALGEEVTEHIEQARTKAGESLAQLRADNPEAAREPAAQAAAELQRAVTTMAREAGEAARSQMAAALGDLNKAASAAEQTPKQDSDDAAQTMAEEASRAANSAALAAAGAARQQQETGSETAAANMNALARSLAAADTQESLRKLRQNPRDGGNAADVAARLRSLAAEAASANRKPLSPEQMTRLVEKLERTRANMKRMAQSANRVPPGEQGAAPSVGGEGSEEPGAGSSEGGEQAGEEAPGDGEKFARQLMGDLDAALSEAEQLVAMDGEYRPLREWVRGEDARSAYRAVVGDFMRLDPPLSGVIEHLRAELLRRQRQHILSITDVEKAPPGYRGAVADYFESISRDYTPADAKPSQGEER